MHGYAKLNFLCKFICTDKDDLEAIVTELDDIIDVERLGLHLGIRMSTLERIQADYSSLERQKTEVICHWLKRRDIIQQKQDERPTVGELADVVARLNPSLSRRIRHKYRYRLYPTLGERLHCKQC